MMKAEG